MELKLQGSSLPPHAQSIPSKVDPRGNQRPQMLANPTQNSLFFSLNHFHTHTLSIPFFWRTLSNPSESPISYLHSMKFKVSCPGVQGGLRKKPKKQHFSTIQEAALAVYSLNSSHLQLWLRITYFSVCRQETKLSRKEAADVLIPALERFSR